MYTLIVKFTSRQGITRLRRSKDLAELLTSCLGLQRIAHSGAIFDVIDGDGISMLIPSKTESLLDQLFQSKI